MSICPQRCVCKLSHSPGQPPLNQTVKAAPRLALPSDSLTEGLHSGLDRKDGWHGCARWLKSTTSHLAWRLPPLQGCWDRSSDWTPICLLLKLSAGMAQRLLFSSTSSDFLNHTLTPSHPHLNILTSSIRLSREGVRDRMTHQVHDESASIFPGSSWRCSNFQFLSSGRSLPQCLFSHGHERDY